MEEELAGCTEKTEQVVERLQENIVGENEIEQQIVRASFLKDCALTSAATT